VPIGYALAKCYLAIGASVTVVGEMYLGYNLNPDFSYIYICKYAVGWRATNTVDEDIKNLAQFGRFRA